MSVSRIPRIRIYHNNLWARYKGAIFSCVHAASGACGVETSFVQVAETSSQRVALGGPDLSYHRYPFELLFPGTASDKLPPIKGSVVLAADLLRHPSDLAVLPGYHRPEYWAMLFVCMLLRRRRAVFVDSTVNDREKRSWWRDAAKAFFFRHCSGFFCYGVRSREYVMGFGISGERVFHRCQAAALPHEYDAAAIRSHYGNAHDLAGSPPRFLYIGRLAAEKGLYDLLDALRAVRERFPDARMDIVGSGSIEADLKERAGRLGLDSVVEFLGPKTPREIGQLLMRSAALVLPSHSEPWGLVVNEALSYGCPVVVSDVCGCVPELVREGTTGYAFPAGDVAALSRAMIAAGERLEVRGSIALDCLDLIEQYTPQHAATEILVGCVRILKPPQ